MAKTHCLGGEGVPLKLHSHNIHHIHHPLEPWELETLRVCVYILCFPSLITTSKYFYRYIFYVRRQIKSVRCQFLPWGASERKSDDSLPRVWYLASPWVCAVICLLCPWSPTEQHTRAWIPKCPKSPLLRWDGMTVEVTLEDTGGPLQSNTQATVPVVSLLNHTVYQDGFVIM